MPLSRALSRASLLVVTTSLVAGACTSERSCEDGPFGGASCTIGGQILTGDALLYNGEQLVFTAQALYGFGPGLPTAVLWNSSDPTVVDVETLLNLTGNATAVDTGTAWVIALINAEFVDSVLVTVVQPGAVRWRNAFPGVAVGAYPAVGADSLVRVVTGGAAPALWVFRHDTGIGTSVASCFSALGPSLGVSDVAYATGDQCTRRHAQGGATLWTAPVGSTALGTAVAADGGAITVSADSVYRVGADGGVVWGRPLGGTPVTAPVIGPGGDVYVGWTVGGTDSVSRIGIDNALRWSAAVPGLSIGTPGVAGGRLLFGRPGGLFALDSTGAVPWDNAFSPTANPAATATSRTSSPVHDDLVAFVQNEEALYAYSVSGTFLWAADSLGYGPTTGPVGAPVLLTDLTLVVPCVAPSGGRDVCAVRQTDGRLNWRSPPGSGVATGLAVGRDGMIFATRTLASGDSELSALWGRVGPSTVGWPTEGGNQQHTRRR